MPTNNIVVFDIDDCLASGLQEVVVREGGFDSNPIIIRNANDLATLARQLDDHDIKLTVICQRHPDALRAIKNVHNRDCDTPILMIRAEGSTEPINTFMEEGVHDVLTHLMISDEPFDLLGVIQTTLIRVSIPNGKANSALLQHLDSQFSALHATLGTIHNDQSKLNGKVDGISKNVEEVSVKVQRHLGWHAENRTFADVMKDPWIWFAKNKPTVIPALILIGSVLILAEHFHLGTLLTQILAIFKK